MWHFNNIKPFSSINQLQSDSAVQSRGSPNGPPMVDGCVVRITFGWSVYAVVRNDDKTLIWLLCCLFFTITRACILRSRLGCTGFMFKFLQSFWNLIGGPLPVVPVKFQSDWSIFPNYIQLLNCKNSVGNLLVAKRTTQGANMGCPFHLWVAFGDRAAIFGQHWRDSMKPVIVNAYSITSFGTTEFCQSYGSSWHSTYICNLHPLLGFVIGRQRGAEAPSKAGPCCLHRPHQSFLLQVGEFCPFFAFLPMNNREKWNGKTITRYISFNRSNGKLTSSLKFLKQTSLEKLEIVRFHEIYMANFWMRIRRFGDYA